MNGIFKLEKNFFDSVNFYVTTPTRTNAIALKNLFDVSAKFSLLDIPELTFSIDLNDPAATYIKEEFLILLNVKNRNYWFVIRNPRDSDTEKGSIRTVTCYSLEYELKNYEVNNFEVMGETLHQFLLGNRELKREGLLDKTLWSVGEVSHSIRALYRSLSLDNDSVLGAINKICEAFGCVPIFDTDARLIHFLDLNSTSFNDGSGLIYVDESFTSNITKESVSDEMTTRLYVYGKDGISINFYSPSGESYIEDYSYFMEGFDYKIDSEGEIQVISPSAYMSDKLCKSIIMQQRAIAKNQDQLMFATSKVLAIAQQASTTKNILNNKRSRLEEIDNLLKVVEKDTTQEEEKAKLERERAEVSKTIAELNDLISQLSVEFQNYNELREKIKEEISDKKFYTGDLVAEKKIFTKEKTVVFPEISNERDLYLKGLEYFNSLKTPKINMEIELINFLSYLGDDANNTSIQLGGIVFVKNSNLKTKTESRVSEITLNFDEKTAQLSLKTDPFFVDETTKIAQVLNVATQTSRSVDLNRAKWEGKAVASASKIITGDLFFLDDLYKLPIPDAPFSVKGLGGYETVTLDISYPVRTAHLNDRIYVYFSTISPTSNFRDLLSVKDLAYIGPASSVVTFSVPTGFTAREGYAYVRVANKEGRLSDYAFSDKITLTEISMNDLKLENMSVELQELINAGVAANTFTQNEAITFVRENGAIAGYRIGSSSSGDLEFSIVADKFKIYNSEKGVHTPVLQVANGELILDGGIFTRTVTAEKISANNISAGTISSSIVKIESENGQLKLIDNTLSIQDPLHQRVLLGKLNDSAAGEYGLILKDRTGKVVLESSDTTPLLIEGTIKATGGEFKGEVKILEGGRLQVGNQISIENGGVFAKSSITNLPTFNLDAHTGELAIGEMDVSGTGLQLTKDSIEIKDNGKTVFFASKTGAEITGNVNIKQGTLGVNNIIVDTHGLAILDPENGTKTILRVGTNNGMEFGLYGEGFSYDMSGVTIARGTIKLGQIGDTENYNFVVGNDGILNATGARIAGAITATEGEIAGPLTIGNSGSITIAGSLVINNSGISAGEFMLGTDGSLSLGNSTNGLYLDSASGIQFRNSGELIFSLDGAGAKFVGNIEARSGTVGGVTIGTDRLIVNETGNPITIGKINEDTYGISGNGFEYDGYSLKLTNANIYLGVKTGDRHPIEILNSGEIYAGNAVVHGKIYADGGTFKNVDIIGNLKVGTSTTGIVIRGSSSGSGSITVGNIAENHILLDGSGLYGGPANNWNFKLDTDGILNARGATIQGNITATTGTFGKYLKITGDNVSVVNATGASQVVFGLFDGKYGIKAGGTELTSAGLTMNEGSISLGGNFVVTKQGTVSIKSGSIYLGHISGDNYYFSVDSGGKLKATEATITGTITATAGQIGNYIHLNEGNNNSIVVKDNLSREVLRYGVKDGKYGLFNNDGFSLTIDGLELTKGSIKIGDERFKVLPDGTMTATGATITGTITSESGQIGGFTLDKGRLHSFDDYGAGVELNADSATISLAFNEEYKTEIATDGIHGIVPYWRVSNFTPANFSNEYYVQIVEVKVGTKVLEEGKHYYANRMGEIIRARSASDIPLNATFTVTYKVLENGNFVEYTETGTFMLKHRTAAIITDDAMLNASFVKNLIVGTAEISHASIVDAHILNISANKITAGTINVEKGIKIGTVNDGVVFDKTGIHTTGGLSITQNSLVLPSKGNISFSGEGTFGEFEGGLKRYAEEQAKDYSRELIIDGAQTILFHYDEHLTSTNGIAPVSYTVDSLVSGKYGNALKIDPTKTLTYNINIPLSQWTISLWAKQISNRPFFLSIIPNSGSKFIFRNTNNTTALIGISGGPAITGAIENPTDWHLYTITYNAGTVKLYFDGELKATGTLSHTATTIKQIAFEHNTTYPTNGLVDELRIDNTVISEEEIKKWYRLEKPFVDLAPKNYISKPTTVTVN